MPERWRRWVCRRWEHKVRRHILSMTVTCSRCGVLLGGPKTFPFTAEEARARIEGEPESGQ
jgi:hypothetical protein